jgi:hypothetical protein
MLLLCRTPHPKKSCGDRSERRNAEQFPAATKLKYLHPFLDGGWQGIYLDAEAKGNFIVRLGLGGTFRVLLKRNN